MKPLILVLMDHYLPGYKSGGPVRTLSNMVTRLENNFQFKIITRDRDLGDFTQYQGIKEGEWNPISNAHVYYMSRNEQISLSSLRRIINESQADLIYLNSFFSPLSTLKPLLLRYLKLVPQVPVILAPRGEFSAGAIALKHFKKRVFLAIVYKCMKYYKNIVWQASSEYEARDIRKWIGNNIKIVVAPDLVQNSYDIEAASGDGYCKVPGVLKVVFLSRISPKKNLLGALNIIGGLKGDIQFNIYGTVGDGVYWEKCKKVMSTLPSNIKACYCGEVPHEKVASIFQQHDLFFFPTYGENFGHVILEALISGCPVLISDETPWRGLQEKGVGWDIPLSDTKQFRTVLSECVKMDSLLQNRLAKCAREYGLEIAKDENAVNENKNMFIETLEGATS